MEIIRPELVTDGEQQYGQLFLPDKPDGRAVLFTHGYATSSAGYTEYAELLAQRGVTCLAVDLRGHGQSEGNIPDLRIADYLAGLRTAYDTLASQPNIDQSRIGAAAASFGAYLMVLLSRERALKSLLLRVPALYPDNLRDIARKDFDTDVVLQTPPDQNNQVLETVRRFNGNIFIVASEHDTIILPSVIAAYVEAAGDHGRYEVIKGAEHALDIPARKVFKDHLLGWANEL